MSEGDAIHPEELAGGLASPIELEYQPLDRHGIERNRRLRRSIVTAVMIRPLALIISFVSVPIFLRYLGPERYGLYEAIIAFSMYLSLSNAGLTAGLVNKLTDCHVSGDRELARRYVSSLWFALLAIVGFFCVVATVAMPLFDWNRLFPSSDPATGAQVPWVVWATAITTFISIIGGVPGSTYAAYQELDRNNYWEGAAKVATLLGCFVVGFTPLGLLGVVLVVLALPTGVRLINTATFFWVEKPWLRPRLDMFDRRLIKSALSEGIYIFALQMAAIAIFQTDKVVISSVLGGESVAGFAIVGRLYLQAYGVFALALATLWPAYGEAARRGDIAWVRRSLRRSIVLGAGVVLMCGLVMFFLGDPVIRIWTRNPALSVSKPLVIAMTALFLCRTLVECQSVFLNGASVFLPQVVLLVVNAALNLVSAVLLAKKFGVIGVAWSFPLTAALTSLWAYPWLIRRYLASVGRGRQ